jgi:hypothetical protein
MDKEQIKELLDSQDFYEVMYAYRIACPENQARVIEKFNDVKKFIIDLLEPKMMVEVISKFIQDPNRPRPKWWDNFVGESFECYVGCSGWWNLTPKGIEKLSALCGYNVGSAIINKDYGKVIS